LQKIHLPIAVWLTNTTMEFLLVTIFAPRLIFSQAIHLQLFFKYLQNLPANAMGNKPGFIDEYCAWIAFGSILYPSSIKPYLLSINNTTEKAIQLKNLYVQIKKNVLIDFMDWRKLATN
jgi:hypothetical protein